MNKLQAIRAQIRGIGRSALVGTMVGILAAQSFAATGPSMVSQPSTVSDATAAPSMIRPANANTTPATNLSNDSAAATSSSNALDLNALPQAPAPVETASASEKPAFDPIISQAAQDGQSLTSTSTKPKSHGVVRPGFLVLGIAGAAAAGLGAYIFSIKTSATGERDALGTMFLAPGAAAAGLGFYFAFKPKKQ
jgi:hypothetical protein